MYFIWSKIELSRVQNNFKTSLTLIDELLFNQPLHGFSQPLLSLISLFRSLSILLLEYSQCLIFSVRKSILRELLDSPKKILFTKFVNCFIPRHYQSGETERGEWGLIMVKKQVDFIIHFRWFKAFLDHVFFSLNGKFH